jgi:hypothetical protein
VAVVVSPAATLGRRLDRAALEDGGLRLGLPADDEVEHGAENVDDGIEAAGVQPASALLVDHIPGWEDGRKIAPGDTEADDPAQAVEDVPKAVDAPAGVLVQQTEVEHDELLFGIVDVPRVSAMIIP